MKTVAEEMIDQAEARLQTLQDVMKDVNDIAGDMPVIPYEIRLIQKSIEGRIIGTKNFLRAIK